MFLHKPSARPSKKVSHRDTVSFHEGLSQEEHFLVLVNKLEHLFREKRDETDNSVQKQRISCLEAIWIRLQYSHVPVYSSIFILTEPQVQVLHQFLKYHLKSKTMEDCEQFLNHSGSMQIVDLIFKCISKQVQLIMKSSQQQQQQEAIQTTEKSTLEKNQQETKSKKAFAIATTADMIELIYTFPAALKRSSLVIDCLLTLLEHCGSHLRQKYFDNVVDKIVLDCLLFAERFSVFESKEQRTEKYNKAAKIFAMIPAFKSKSFESYSNQLNMVLSSMDYLLNICYDLLEDKNILLQQSLLIAEEKEISIGQTLFKNEFTDLMDSYKFACLFNNLSKALHYHLTLCYPFSMNLDLKRILTILIKGLNLETQLRTHSKANHPLLPSTLKQVIPFIHECSLQNIHALLFSVRGYAAPFVHSLCAKCIDLYRFWTAQPISMTVVAVYHQLLETVNQLISIYGSGVSQQLSTKLLPLMVKQLHQFENQFQLKRANLESHKVNLHNFTEISIRKRRKMHSKQSSGANSIEKIYSSQEYDLLVLMTQMTLLSMNHMITICKSFLSTGKNQIQNLTVFADVISFLLQQLELYFEMIDYAKLESEWLEEARIMTPLIDPLISLLLSSFMVTSLIHAQSSFLPKAMELLKQGTNCTHLSVASKCVSALNVMESFLHPRAAPIYIPTAESILSYLNRNDSKEEESDENTDEVMIPAQTSVDYETLTNTQQQKPKEEKQIEKVASSHQKRSKRKRPMIVVEEEDIIPKKNLFSSTTQELQYSAAPIQFISPVEKKSIATPEASITTNSKVASTTKSSNTIVSSVEDEVDIEINDADPEETEDGALDDVANFSF